jgi:protein involved in polysaccharide export with SLBB domain
MKSLFYRSKPFLRRDTIGSRLIEFLTLLCAIFCLFTPRFISQGVRSSTTTQSVAETDLVHYGDLIDVDVVGSLEYDWRGTINPEGFLDGFSPNNETVYGLCRSEEALADEITKIYSQILKNPKIEVKVLDRSGRAVTMLLGAVRNRQRFKLGREVHLKELIALSGGVTDAANGEITIFRPPDLNCYTTMDANEKKSPSVMRYKISQLLQGDEGSNPAVLSGDIVTVVEASPIYVIGGVNVPRPISSRDEVSVLRAIAAAGGLSKEANESDVMIYRRDGKDSKTISVDLKKISAKRQDDLLLRPFDIVDVGQKGRARSKYLPTVNSEQISRDIFRVPVRIID